MHYTPKKTVEQIIESGNDYLIAVKKNQPTLYQQLETEFAERIPDSVNEQTERTRDRQTQRIVSVLEVAAATYPDWAGVQRLIRVERFGQRGKQPYHETMFYISSRPTDADEFSVRVRDHWHIENRLHWVKDVVLLEDTALLCDGYAPANFAILRAIAINLLRQAGFASITRGIRAVAHDVHRLFSFFQ
jgi:predicted transposase YbfD/YdcC